MIKSSPKIFIDSSLFLAFIDRTDLNHQKAATVFDFLARQRYRVYTSSLVFWFTFQRLEKELGTTISYDFLQAILESSIEIVFPQKTDLIFIYRFLRNNQTKQISLSDIANARIMEKLSISTILTFDNWSNLLGTKVSNLITDQ